MKPANLKVISILESAGLDLEVRILPEAVRTAQLAADALECEIGQIANSLIFRDIASANAVLIMSSGGRRVDLDKVRQLTGLQLGKADAEFVRNQTGFAIGGVPPVGHSNALTTILDISLREHDEIWAAAGTPDSIFCLNPGLLEQLTSGDWLNVAED